MKKKICYIILGIILSFSFKEQVFAKNVVKECHYTYVNELRKDGRKDIVSSYQESTLTFYIYDDGSQEGSGKCNDPFSVENFGENENILNWGKSDNDAPDIKGSSCPDYIGVIVQGAGDRKWYGFSSSNLSTDGSKVAAYDNSSSMSVFKNDDFKDTTYKCIYQLYSITVDAKQELLISESRIDSLNFWISDELKTSWFSEERQTAECLSTLACYDEGLSPTNYYIFNDAMEAASAGYKKCEKKECMGDDCASESSPSCITYNKYLNEIDSLYSQIKDATGNTKNLYADVHAKEKILETLCKSVMASYDYSEKCVKACVHVNSDIASIKDKYGAPEDEEKNANCGFSTRLVNWIMKFINWMRYIIPVLLIILSVLDYIKAIASDSEDEVKKVTSRFVKRLIVSVCIFLIPLALEFLLGIFGINANNFCL